MGKAISERKRWKHTGRGKGHTFLALPHYIIQSPEWRALSGNAVKFLIELASGYDGHNNGDLSFTRRQALERGWNSAGTRDRAAQELLEAGWLVLNRAGGRNTCNLYAVTWLPIDDVGAWALHAAETTASHRWRWPHNRSNVVPLQGHKTQQVAP